MLFDLLPLSLLAQSKSITAFQLLLRIKMQIFKVKEIFMVICSFFSLPDYCSLTHYAFFFSRYSLFFTVLFHVHLFIILYPSPLPPAPFFPSNSCPYVHFLLCLPHLYVLILDVLPVASATLAV